MRGPIIDQCNLPAPYQVFPVQMEDGPDAYCVASVDVYNNYQFQVGPDYATRAEAAAVAKQLCAGE